MINAISSQISLGYAQGKALAAAPAKEASIASFAKSFSEILSTHEHTAMNAMLGQGDPTALAQALSESKFAVETVATLRDRVVEAYQEILRMPI